MITCFFSSNAALTNLARQSSNDDADDAEKFRHSHRIAGASQTGMRVVSMMAHEEDKCAGTLRAFEM